MVLTVETSNLRITFKEVNVVEYTKNTIDHTYCLVVNERIILTTADDTSFNLMKLYESLVPKISSENNHFIIRQQNYKYAIIPYCTNI